MEEALVVFYDRNVDFELEVLLRTAGIDLELWGKDATKTVAHLAKEIRERESKIFLDKNKELVREIYVAAVTVTYTDSTGTYVLVEDHQVFKNGANRSRVWDSSVSEKFIEGEEPIEAFRRALLQELPQIKELRDSEGKVLGPTWVDSLCFDYMGPPELRTHYSSSFPRLRTRRIVHNAIVKLSKEHYIPQGYCEVQDGLTTYFVWKKVE